MTSRRYADDSTVAHLIERRTFLQGALAASLAGCTLGEVRGREVSGKTEQGLALAAFRFDVTPPKGHSLCGGWIKPVLAVDDPLESLGFVLLGAGLPIVLCTVDWTGILNEAHVEWRRALAKAAGTTLDRVAVHCVHQHNAPFACLEAERLVAAHDELPHIVDVAFFRRTLETAREAVKDALPRARAVTHIAHGQGRVEKVASNRRVHRDETGKIRGMRGSSCADAELRALPEGLIDPWLKTVAFYDGDTKIASCHYYATHPMSYYGDGRVTTDFAGLARRRRQREEPDCLHLYFTGCAGNIAAGKYNDGSKENRPILTQRIYDGIVRSEDKLKPEPIGGVTWKTVELLPPPRADLAAAKLHAAIANKEGSPVSRSRPAFMASWLDRVEKKVPIVLSSLAVNEVSLLHLPAECFVEYQLRAQKLAPSSFVATAAYGDGGPWYIPVAEEYANGGYEVSVAFCAQEVDTLLSAGIQKLL
jgi:hypothetical protein